MKGCYNLEEETIKVEILAAKSSSTNETSVYKLVINADFKTAITLMQRHHLQYNLLIKHARDEIASILCWEDEAVGPRPQVVTGGLDLWEESTQHVARVGYYGCRTFSPRTFPPDFSPGEKC